MRCISFNVNGLRARLHQLERLVTAYQPDIIGLQETKVDDGAFPEKAIQKLGYHALFHGQKGHYGVALLSRIPAVEIRRGFPGDPADAQKRLICADYPFPNGVIRVINGYFPQGENRDHPTKFPAKQSFYSQLRDLLANHYHRTDNIILMGDMNVAPTDLDVGIGEDNAKRWLRTGKCGFLPEERAWLQTLEEWGLQDSFRHLHPTSTQALSWFDYRSRGFQRSPRRGLRIDLILASGGLIQCLEHAEIYYDIRAMDKPSDHCPVAADFLIESAPVKAILNQ